MICCLVCPDHNVHQEPGRKWPENLALLTFVSALNYLKIKIKAQCLLSSFISTLQKHMTPPFIHQGVWLVLSDLKITYNVTKRGLNFVDW